MLIRGTLLLIIIAAFTQVAQAETEQDYTLLESIDREQPNFVEALEELQKIHFARSEWQKFFGYALYYRKNVLGGADAARKFSDRMISLELLALAKHCRFDEAQAIGSGALDFADKHQLTDSAHAIEATMQRLGLTRQFPKAVAAHEDLKRPRLVFSNELLWKVDSSQLKDIKHPRALRVLVASRCSK